MEWQRFLQVSLALTGKSRHLFPSGPSNLGSESSWDVPTSKGKAGHTREPYKAFPPARTYRASQGPWSQVRGALLASSPTFQIRYWGSAGCQARGHHKGQASGLPGCCRSVSSSNWTGTKCPTSTLAAGTGGFPLRGGVCKLHWTGRGRRGCWKAPAQSESQVHSQGLAEQRVTSPERPVASHLWHEVALHRLLHPGSYSTPDLPAGVPDRMEASASGESQEQEWSPLCVALTPGLPRAVAGQGQPAPHRGGPTAGCRRWVDLLDRVWSSALPVRHSSSPILHSLRGQFPSAPPPLWPKLTAPPPPASADDVFGGVAWRAPAVWSLGGWHLPTPGPPQGSAPHTVVSMGWGLVRLPLLRTSASSTEEMLSGPQMPKVRPHPQPRPHWLQGPTCPN